jgi:hypothetical protein
MDRHADRHADRHVDRQTDRQNSSCCKEFRWKPKRSSPGRIYQRSKCHAPNQPQKYHKTIWHCTINTIQTGQSLVLQLDASLTNNTLF